MSKLLFDEHPLVIQPQFAKIVGLNESIIIQQLHYWLQKSDNIRDGYKWIYNTYQDWHKQFPFWGLNTIRRAIAKLEESGFIVTGNYNKLKIDNTKWYRIDYEKLEGLGRPIAQNGQTDIPKWADGQPKVGRPLPEITTENTSDIYTTTAEGINPFTFYEQNGFGTIPPLVIEEMNIWIDGNYFEQPNEIIILAMKEAVLSNVRNWNYVNKILINWEQKKLKTVDQVQAHLTEHKAKRNSPSPTTRRKSNLNALDELKKKYQGEK
jgi:DnaD/phage-associated family protein